MELDEKSITVSVNKKVSQGIIVYSIIILSFLSVAIFVKYPTKLSLEYIKIIDHNHARITVTSSDLITISKGDSLRLITIGESPKTYIVQIEAIKKVNKDGFLDVVSLKNHNSDGLNILSQTDGVSIYAYPKTLVNVLFFK